MPIKKMAVETNAFNHNNRNIILKILKPIFLCFLPIYISKLRYLIDFNCSLHDSHSFIIVSSSVDLNYWLFVSKYRIIDKLNYLLPICEPKVAKNNQRLRENNQSSDHKSPQITDFSREIGHISFPFYSS